MDTVGREKRGRRCGWKGEGVHNIKGLRCHAKDFEPVSWLWNAMEGFLMGTGLVLEK